MPVIQERMTEMEKAMLSSNCNHVQGDDTDIKGFSINDT